MKLSVVIPVYNEEETLRYSIDRLFNALLPLRSEASHSEGWASIELLFVNDGSRDQSFRILKNSSKELSNSFIQIRPLNLSRNFGHSAAVLAGLERATGDVLAIIDADLQDPPELLPKMLQLMHEEEADVVYGQRAKREQETAFKRFTAWAFYRLLDRITGVDIPPDTGDFRVMTREVVEAVLSCKENDPFLRGLVAWVGFKQIPFRYTREGRKFGTTKYPFSKMVKFAITAIVNFSDTPLRLAFFVGLAGMMFFAALVVWALWANMRGITVPGWTSLLIGFTLGQSVTLLILGVMSYYSGQTFRQVQKRPRYILRSTENT